MEISLDGEHTEKKEEAKGYPGTPNDSFLHCEENPKTQKGEEKEAPTLIRKGKVKMTQIDSNGVSGKNWDER
jgi:hypothetical protein